MATAKPKSDQKPQPEKSEPADAQIPESNYNYDADEKSKERLHAVITIGGEQFHRVKKDWRVTRELRKLLRVQEKQSELQLRLVAQKDALTEKIRGVRDWDEGGWKSHPLDPIDDAEAIDEIDKKVEEIDGRIDTTHEASDQAAYDMLRLLVRAIGDQTPEGVKPDVLEWDEEAEQLKPADGFLKSELDAQEAGELVSQLSSNQEPDPTTTAPSS